MLKIDILLEMCSCQSKNTVFDAQLDFEFEYLNMKIVYDYDFIFFIMYKITLSVKMSSPRN